MDQTEQDVGESQFLNRQDGCIDKGEYSVRKLVLDVGVVSNDKEEQDDRKSRSEEDFRVFMLQDFPDKIDQNTKNGNNNQSVFFNQCQQNQDISYKNQKIPHPDMGSDPLHRIVNEHKKEDINENRITIKQHKVVLKYQSVKVLQK